MLELLRLVLGTFRVASYGRHALLLENLVLRQQLAVLLRTKRPRLQRRDKVLWVLVRWLRHGWAGRTFGRRSAS